MGGTELGKCAATTAAEVCDGFELGDQAKQLLAGGQLDRDAEPGAFLDRLLQFEQNVDALRFLAYALPHREAVWWACRCVRAISPELVELPGVEAAEAWLRVSSDENRRAAMAVAQSLGFASADAWAAVGAFWAEGSMGPPDAPEVPPGKALTGHAVAGAVLLAAVQSEPEKASEKHGRFIALGVDVANGIDTWEQATAETGRSA